jgi:hypothetical protein
MARSADLLSEVQRDALDPKTPLADTLRKLVALGGIAGSTELRAWAGLELRGYLHSEVELPEYRKPSATLKVDAIKGNYQITGQQISPRFLPEFAQFSRLFLAEGCDARVGRQPRSGPANKRTHSSLLKRQSAKRSRAETVRHRRRRNARRGF